MGSLLLFTQIQEIHKQFWQNHPALLIGVCLLIGSSSYLFLNTLSFLIIWLLYLIFCKKHLFVFLLIAAYLYGYACQLPEDLSTNNASGIFVAKKLSPHISPFNKSLLLQGDFYYQKHCLATAIFIKPENNDFKANKTYKIEGDLIAQDRYKYVLKPLKFLEVKNNGTLGQLRFELKQKVKEFIQKKIANFKAANFLNAIITAEVDDRMLRYEFSKTGVQHVLAVSGFHFGIIILFLQTCLYVLENRRLQLSLLCFGIFLYFLFVGSNPAIFRSFIAAFLWTFGKIFHLKSSGLNLMGCALAIEMIYDPTCAQDVGFQFSFLSCLGILCFYLPIEKRFKGLFKQQDNSTNFNLFHKGVFYAGKFLRTSLSLDLAVNITLQPLLFYYFFQFSFLSSFFNLFFPFLVSICAFLLLISMVVYIAAPPIGDYLFILLNLWTKNILTLTSSPLPFLDFSFTYNGLKENWIIAYLLFIFLFYISKTRPLDDFDLFKNPEISEIKKINTLLKKSWQKIF